MNNYIITTSLVLLVLLAACNNKSVNQQVQRSNELDYRLEQVVTRITQGELPRITKDFLLAGLTLDPRFERRFTNYSGDQIGRYLSAMSQTDTTRQSINIHELVDAVITYQKADGRFGADTLAFDVNSIGGPQMALLWGNGRLLTGLMDYNAKYPGNQKVLASARKLGDFLEGVIQACSRPEIINRFKTMGALGFICFTQITEGMVKLYTATGTEKYKKAAETTYPLLPEFGNQHSHGYLNTLRGVVMLYEATKNPVHLHYVEDIFKKIVTSENYLITGGLPEFFNFYGSADGVRDEGCSEADFFMLCLQLWKATGNDKYLDTGEYLLMNHMLYNQFLSGDFGHHVIKQGFGFVTAPAPGQSWWCCNYHGLQALHAAIQAVVTKKDNLRKVNLFYPADYKDDEMSFVLHKVRNSLPYFELAIGSVTSNSPRLAIRNPYWSRSVTLKLNGITIEPLAAEGYLVINQPLKQGDILHIILHPVLKLVDEERNEIDPDSFSAKPVKAALIYGPWLMCADDVYQNLFMTELSENNIIYLPNDPVLPHAPEIAVPQASYNPESYLSFDFLKDGTSQTGMVILRPISEISYQDPSNVRYWFYFSGQIRQ